MLHPIEVQNFDEITYINVLYDYVKCYQNNYKIFQIFLLHILTKKNFFIQQKLYSFIKLVTTDYTNLKT